MRENGGTGERRRSSIGKKDGGSEGVCICIQLFGVCVCVSVCAYNLSMYILYVCIYL